ncbi:hypothetical protein X759_35685 [Mesorhizobium sp. LSHC420B00]|nr:hypothetical protein X759_35685 [Mesorhizobium sp. LSHC420B00]
MQQVSAESFGTQEQYNLVIDLMGADVYQGTLVWSQIETEDRNQQLQPSIPARPDKRDFQACAGPRAGSRAARLSASLSGSPDLRAGL